MERIHILLPVHNRKNVTQYFISCLQTQTYSNYHLILIDDGSIDGTAEMVQDKINPLTVIKGCGNWWWGGSLQQGYLWLRSHNISLSDLVLIINDDSTFDCDYLETALNLITIYKRTILASECYSQQTKELIDSGVLADWKNNRFVITQNQEQINCFSTRGLFLRWGDFLEIGGFYPRLLPHHAADYEFTIRAIRKGLHPMTDKRLKIWINESTTGYYELPPEHGWKSLRKLFSKKSASNPITLTVFIALSCPWRWKVRNWLSVWKRALIQIITYLIFPNLYLQNDR